MFGVYFPTANTAGFQSKRGGAVATCFVSRKSGDKPASDGCESTWKGMWSCIMWQLPKLEPIYIPSGLTTLNEAYPKTESIICWKPHAQIFVKVVIIRQNKHVEKRLASTMHCLGHPQNLNFEPQTIVWGRHGSCLHTEKSCTHRVIC